MLSALGQKETKRMLAASGAGPIYGKSIRVVSNGLMPLTHAK